VKRGLAIAVVAVALAAALSPRAEAAAPTLESVFPAGGRQGQTIDLTLLGKFEPWPCEVWFSAPGLSFEPDPEKAGSGKLAIAAEAPLGPVLVRAHNAEGASAPIIFIVGDRPEILDEEKDGSTLAGAAAIDRAALPLVVNGTLTAGGEVDAWRLRLEKGETLHALVEGYGLRSPLDPALNLHDAEGNRLLVAHDGPANLDPGFSYEAAEAGDHIVSLVGFSHPPAASVAYVGSKNAHYRLHLALRREDLPARLLPADPGPDSPEPTLTPGEPLVGTLAAPASPNRHPVEVKKGDKLLVRVVGRGLGYPIDPVLRILKPDGGEIRREDDTGKSSDPEYLWTVAEDGLHTLEVSDRYSRGGAEMRYRLEAAPPRPDFQLVADKSFYALERGKPLELKVKLTRRHGHAGDLELSLAGLPDTIAATFPEKAPEKDGDLVVKLEAKEDAPAFSGPFRLVATERRGEGEEDKGEPLARDAVFTFVDDNWRGPYAIDEFPDLWLTLPPPPPKEEEKKEDAKEGEKKPEE
jgi:hypothetical protein